MFLFLNKISTFIVISLIKDIDKYLWLVIMYFTEIKIAQLIIKTINILHLSFILTINKFYTVRS